MLGAGVDACAPRLPHHNGCPPFSTAKSPLPRLGNAMILAALGLGGIGLWFLIAGDGAGRLVGVGFLLVAGFFVFLLWVALAVERPISSASTLSVAEVFYG